MKIPIAKPLFDDDELKAVLEPIRSGWVSQGPIVEKFEILFKNYIGTRYASAVSSGTAALHLALIACGIKPGDRVITTPFTCIATVNPIEYIGAEPVFVDIDLSTYNINVNQIEEAISEKVKAIVVVHLFGLCTNMDVIMRIAQKYNLIVIEDAACALGAFFKGKHAGTFGNAGCFSFHPRKMITTGEGGMIVTNSEDIDLKVKMLRNYGASISTWRRHHGKFYVLPEYELLGFNYKMTDIQASLGVVQMYKLENILKRRTQIARRYSEELASLDWLILPQEIDNSIHAYQSYVCLFNPNNTISYWNKSKLEQAHQKRNKLMEWLAEKGIATVGGARAIHTLSYYKKKYAFKESDFPNALIADKLTIALPIHPLLTDAEQEYIIKAIKAFEKHLK